jgi:hypothetical protein
MVSIWSCNSSATWWSVNNSSPKVYRHFSLNYTLDLYRKQSLLIIVVRLTRLAKPVIDCV